jgi:hypothetical protein
LKKGILLLVFLLLVGAAYYISTGYFSDGERAGTISKLSQRGYIFKTYEGELNEGGFSGETGSMSARIWTFSAKEDSVIADLQKALATGERVTLKYQEKFLQFAWNGDTKYFVTDVKFLPAPPPPPVMVQPEVAVPPVPVVIDTTKK